jgi:hypothetical protein
VLATTGDEFAFAVRRCYLSSGVYDHADAHCAEPYRPDMQDDFQFYGEAEGTSRDDAGQGHRSTLRLEVEVLGHWVMVPP